MGKKAEEKRRSDFKGLKKVLVRLEDRHVKALTTAAERRAKLARAQQADKTKLVRADKSAIVREALDLHPELKGRG